MRKTVSAFLFLIILSSLCLNTQGLPHYIETKIYRDGYVFTKIVLYISNVSVINFSLFKNPENIIVTDENNLPLNYTLNENRITVICPETKIVRIIFVTSSTTKKEGAIWHFKLEKGYYNITIKLPDNAVVLNTDPLPIKIFSVDNTIALTFSKSPIDLEYTLLPPKSSNNTKTNDSGNSNTNTAETISPNKEEDKAPSIMNEVSICIAVLVVIVVILLLVAKIIFKKTNAMLTEEERDIISFIRSRGGRAYLTEIVRGLGLPKTTVWRKVRRLEKMGYLKTERVREGLLVYIK
ncbi:MAG: hypothetical protein DRJ64_01970 [Thermoprotei archaeon]|nr:MAG: hypothetical protein DRJ64_01970 [Thermoprotei archaeon]